MITYLIHTTSIWLILLVGYQVLLSKEKYFILNRIYLLFSLALGLLLPFMQFFCLTSNQVIPEVAVIYHKQVDYISNFSSVVGSAEIEATALDWSNASLILLFLGMVMTLIRNLIAGFKLRSLYKNSNKFHYQQFTEVRTEKSHLPFSFFRYIFFSSLSFKENDRLSILSHEIHHVTAKHSWDVLFIEIIKVFFWWNPLVYLYKNAITVNHEYAADHSAMTQGTRKEYCALLLQSNLPGVNLDLGHPFFQTYIKKRIDMMYRKQSSWKSYFKFALPAMAMVLMAFVMQESPSSTPTFIDMEVSENVDQDGGTHNGVPSISPIAKKDILNKEGRTSGFGMRMHPIHKVNQFHKGIDLIAKLNTPVYVTADGIVTRVESRATGYGNNVVVAHESGYSTLYAHLNSVNVRLDQKLERGQQLGLVGTSGTSARPHLHYEVRKNGNVVDPIHYGLSQLHSDNNEKSKSSDTQKESKKGMGSVEDGSKDLNLVQHNLNEKGTINLGSNVDDGIVVKVGKVILEEGSDYILDRNLGILRFTNLEYLNSNVPVHVEFTSNE